MNRQFNDRKDFLSEGTWPSNWHYGISITSNNGGLLQLPAMCRDKVMWWLLRLRKAVGLGLCCTCHVGKPKTITF